MKRSSQIMQEKLFSFQNNLKIFSLYSFMNEKITFFMITEELTKISSSNYMYLCIIEL